MKQRCRWGLCTEMLEHGQKYCPKHADAARQKFEAYVAMYESNRREYDQTYKAFYDGKEWKAMRETVLSEQGGLCSCGKWASIVHHKIALKADWSKRLERSNLEGLCWGCHSKHELTERNKKKQDNKKGK